MAITPILLSALPIASTFLGGLVVLRWKKDLHPWLSLSGGLLLGVAFLDLLPEAIDQGVTSGLDVKVITGLTLLAILVFHLLDKALSFHAHHEHPDGHPEEACHDDRHRGTKAVIRAASMIVHSVLDGVAIGAGFAVDLRLGVLVTIAVITHDFSDGMSTVTVLKAGLGHGHRSILPLLIADALAPFLGAMIGIRLGLNGAIVAGMLAFFSGFFIFLALSDLLPQAHSGKLARRYALALTTLGILAVVFIQSFVSI